MKNLEDKIYFSVTQSSFKKKYRRMFIIHYKHFK